MGGCTFQTEEFGSTPKSAYLRAVEQAYYDHGHDPYNGTISTTRGFDFVELGEDEDPFVYAKEHYNDYDKWDSCGCVELTEKFLRRVSLGIPGDPHREQVHYACYLLSVLKEHPGRRCFLFFGWAAT